MVFGTQAAVEYASLIHLHQKETVATPELNEGINKLKELIKIKVEHIFERSDIGIEPTGNLTTAYLKTEKEPKEIGARLIGNNSTIEWATDRETENTFKVIREKDDLIFQFTDRTRTYELTYNKSTNGVTARELSNQQMPETINVHGCLAHATQFINNFNKQSNA